MRRTVALMGIMLSIIAATASAQVKSKDADMRRLMFSGMKVPGHGERINGEILLGL